MAERIPRAVPGELSGAARGAALAAPPAEGTTSNIAATLVDAAARHPDADAVRVVSTRGRATRVSAVSFAHLDARSNALASGLARRGLERGDRVCVFVRPGADLIVVSFALFKLGAVPVLIDPGMGRVNVARCVERMAPRGLVGVPAAHLVRRLHARAFGSVELAVTVGPRMPGGGPTLARLEAEGSRAPVLARLNDQDPAAILFTSGSTGPPKGVRYTHGMFQAQVRALKDCYGFEPGEVDAACFPLFALFSPALGMTCAFPELDASHPARCDPARIVAAIEATGATSSFGSPAIWRRVVPWCVEHGVVLGGLRRVLVAGAPVPPELIEDFLRILPPDADVHTPYGATEALPVSTISGREILSTASEGLELGLGTCVGMPAPGIEVRLIRIDDEPIAEWGNLREVPDGEPGEVCVSGAVVTREYAFEPGATAAAKSRDGERIWHRMGDVGTRTADGRLWFGGRKAHRIETPAGLVMPVAAETAINVHPSVRRSALVGVGPRGEERPVLVIEPASGRAPRGAAARDSLRSELLALARRRPASAVATDVLFHRGFPVDVRHNAKIDREALKRWAETRRP
ncbi:MAG: fatty acid CoA ligase family protein [Planctomycetota bacterium]|nr:fatty acid CoA ligase family protein [Planctomycetota bacterium]